MLKLFIPSEYAREYQQDNNYNNYNPYPVEIEPPAVSFRHAAHSFHVTSLRITGHPRGWPAADIIKCLPALLMTCCPCTVLLAVASIRIEKQKQEQDYEEQNSAVVTQKSAKIICHKNASFQSEN
jgi:hypothetical protein